MLGGPRRLGWWTLPLFVAVGLLGAVLAGAVTAVYYAQKVAQLERETAEGRRQLTVAVERVREAAEKAVAAVRTEVDAFRDEVAVTLPIKDPAKAGVVSVRAEVTIQPPPETSPPLAAPDSTEPPPPAPPPPPPRTVVREGSGFAAVTGGGDAYFVTSFSVVADPDRSDVPIEGAEITLGGRSYSTSVHSWDPQNDLALLRADGVGDVATLPWRPVGEAITPGQKVFAVGNLPSGSLVQLSAMVGAVDHEVVVTDLVVPAMLRGGPLVDAQGRVVGVGSGAYRESLADSGSADTGGTNTAVPVRILCERLIRCSSRDMQPQ